MSTVRIQADEVLVYEAQFRLTQVDRIIGFEIIPSYSQTQKE